MTPPQPPVAEEAVNSLRVREWRIDVTRIVIEMTAQVLPDDTKAVQRAINAFVHALSVPPSPAGEDVERVARVIGGDALKSEDEIYRELVATYPWWTTKFSADAAASMFSGYEAQRTDALRKAREIIALLSGRKQDD